MNMNQQSVSFQELRERKMHISLQPSDNSRLSINHVLKSLNWRFQNMSVKKVKFTCICSFTNTHAASWILIVQFCASSQYLLLPFGNYNSIASVQRKQLHLPNYIQETGSLNHFFRETVVSIFLMECLRFYLIWTRFSFLITLFVGSSFPRISFPIESLLVFSSFLEVLHGLPTLFWAILFTKLSILFYENIRKQLHSCTTRVFWLHFLAALLLCTLHIAMWIKTFAKWNCIK